MSEENKYNIDTVWRDECLYKHPKGGMQVGIFPKGVRIEDIENEIIIISLGERSQLQNKEKAMNFFNLANQLQTAKEELKRLKTFVNSTINCYEDDWSWENNAKSGLKLYEEYNNKVKDLTQQNKQMRGTLEKIVNYKGNNEFYCSSIAQQALKGGE